MGSQELSEVEYWYFEGRNDGYHNYDTSFSVPPRYLEVYLEGIADGELEKCWENEQDIQEFYQF